MNLKIDLTFYNQIKEKFGVEKDTIVFISLAVRSIDELEAQVFSKATYNLYCWILDEHLNEKKPYVVIDHIDKEPTFYLACKEFGREENLTDGSVTYFELNPFEDLEVDMDKLRSELAQLGQLLSTNSKAS
jgi:hypothetical protein